MLQCMYIYVASVYCKCFIHFGRTLQVFHQQARLGGAGRGGPLGCSGPRVRRKPSRRDTGAGAQSYIYGRGSKRGARSASILGCSLSLFQLDAPGQYVAASRSCSSMRAAGVHG
jgi:hypothetical protein